jgi:acetylornithine deacetylase/succinyl-diaminopimelate desuccinylase-like protein
MVSFMTPAVTVSPAKSIDELLVSSGVMRAFEFFEEQAAEITADQIRICSIPAPPFGEAERAAHLLEVFRRDGLTDLQLDEEGNCVALRRGQSLRPLLVVAAHLDTVFPPGTDYSVRASENTLFAPGVADDGCGLAALIALNRALQLTRIETVGSVLVVGTVGEEGEGNLRGVRHLLFAGDWANRVEAFLSLDGPGADRITNEALGSRRYRVRFAGRGGHSWGDFGVENPVHAVGRTIARLASYPTPLDPRTTFNVGRIEGGTGVNVIPQEATMDVDLRSASSEELWRLDAFFRRAVRESVDDENANHRLNEPLLEVDLQLIGDRPGGRTPVDSPLVELAVAATRAVGCVPRLEQASTDSNIPISMGIPAITLGGGGTSGNSHTLDEWYDPRHRDLGLKRALLVMLGLVGLQQP